MKGKIFNTQDLQEIVLGSKARFLEPLRPQPILNEDKSFWIFKKAKWAGDNSEFARRYGNNVKPNISDLCNYKVGKKIYIKEDYYEDNIYRIFAGYDHIDNGIKIPARLMPQEYSRFTLEITRITVDKKDGVWVWVVDFENINN